MFSKFYQLLQTYSPLHSEVDHYVVDFEKGCSTQSYMAFFIVVPCFTMLTDLLAYNTPPTWVMLGSCGSNVTCSEAHST
jgi:hypothetical protein